MSRRMLEEGENRFSISFSLGAEAALNTAAQMVAESFFIRLTFPAELGRAFPDLQPYALYPPAEYLYDGTEANWGRFRAPQSRGTAPAFSAALRREASTHKGIRGLSHRGAGFRTCPR